MKDIEYIIKKIGWIAALAQLYKENKLSASNTRRLMEGTKAFLFEGVDGYETVDMDTAFIWYTYGCEQKRMTFQEWLVRMVKDKAFEA